MPEMGPGGHWTPSICSIQHDHIALLPFLTCVSLIGILGRVTEPRLLWLPAQPETPLAVVKSRVPERRKKDSRGSVTQGVTPWGRGVSHDAKGNADEMKERSKTLHPSLGGRGVHSRGFRPPPHYVTSASSLQEAKIPTPHPKGTIQASWRGRCACRETSPERALRRVGPQQM